MSATKIRCGICGSSRLQIAVWSWMNDHPKKLCVYVEPYHPADQEDVDVVWCDVCGKRDVPLIYPGAHRADHDKACLLLKDRRLFHQLQRRVQRRRGVMRGNHG